MSKAEPTIEEKRADAVRRLTAPGARRIGLVAALAEVDAELHPLVVQAVQAGVTVRRVGELVGLSPGAVSLWARNPR